MAFQLIPGETVAIDPNPLKTKPGFPVDIVPPTPAPTVPGPLPVPIKSKPTIPASTQALMAQLEALLAAKPAQQQPVAPQPVPAPVSIPLPVSEPTPTLSSLFASTATPAKAKPFLPTDPGPEPVVNRIPETQFNQLYRDWLGRDPAPGDYNLYGNNTFDAVKAVVVNSKEHTDRWDAQVNAWFREFKGRDGTAAELSDLRGKYLENIQAARNEIKGGVASPTAPTGGFNANWWAQLTNGKPPTPASLIAMEAELNALGIKVLRNAEGVAGKIQLPDGRIIDVIVSAGLGGRGWQWDDSAGGGGGNNLPPPPGTPAVPLTPIGSQFNDPYTKQLEDFLKFRIEELFQPVDDPFRDQYAQLLQSRTDALGESDPDLDATLALLREQVARAGEKPEDNPEFMKLMNWINTRFEDLSHPGYTGAENEVIRTMALDPIERDRDAAQKRALETISARGMTPDSGLAQELQAMVNQGFDASRATAQGDIALNEIQRRNDLMNQATTYAQMGYQLPEDFTQSRINTGISAGAAITDISDARAREALDTANALFGISKGVRDETQNRRQEALSLIGMLADLPVQALKNAMLVLGTGEQPGDIMSSLLTIAGLNQRQGQINTGNSQGFWAGLGTLARILQGSGVGSSGNTSGNSQANSFNTGGAWYPNGG